MSFHPGHKLSLCKPTILIADTLNTDIKSTFCTIQWLIPKLGSHMNDLAHIFLFKFLHRYLYVHNHRHAVSSQKIGSKSQTQSALCCVWISANILSLWLCSQDIFLQRSSIQIYLRKERFVWTRWKKIGTLPNGPFIISLRYNDFTSLTQNAALEANNFTHPLHFCLRLSSACW